MINFKYIEYKNFLSTGNIPNRIELNSHKSTLLTGLTGNGKSTIIEAIIFVLFNKPFRNISKREQIINSINGKQCELTIEFETNGYTYKVIRGLKPDKFEIYCDNTLIKQEANSRDYQAFLEKQILKVNYKTFTQVVVLGSTNYIPFMKLSALDRRSVIEDILDITVFSTMNELLKKKTAIISSDITTAEQELYNIKNKAIGQKKIIDTLQKTHEDVINTYRDNINIHKLDIDKHNNTINKLNKDAANLRVKLIDTSTIKEEMNKINKEKYVVQASITTLTKEITFFSNNETCPVCVQDINANHKHNIVENNKTQLKTNKDLLINYEDTIAKISTELNNNLAISNQISELLSEIRSNNNTINYLNNQISNLQSNITSLQSKENIDIQSEQDILKNLITQGKELNNRKNELIAEKNIHDVSALLLKDNGIKATIIKEYITVINKLINQYINDLELYVKFELDENFKETIKSRHRDKFEYSSFSAGEAQKLDLAILFTWRQIAKMKNSCNTNLLIMDEVLDGHLDSFGTQSLLEIFNKEQDMNLFVITHSPENYNEHFDNHIHITKKNDFTVLDKK